MTLAHERAITDQLLTESTSATARLFAWTAEITESNYREYLELVQASGDERKQAGDPRLAG